MYLIVLLLFGLIHTNNNPSINQGDIFEMGKTLVMQNLVEPTWIKETRAPIVSSIKLADVDLDSIDEIIVTTYDTLPAPYSGGWVYILNKNGDDLPGWPKRTSAPFPADPVVGDIDNDGDMEIVVGDWSRAHIWNHDGTYFTGWPINKGTYSTAALADLDGDGDLEIIYSGSDNKLYIWHHNATNFSNWPQTLPETPTSPVIGDIDNDDTLEIVVGTYQGPVGPEPFEIYAFETNGTIRTGFPFSTSGVVKSTPAIGDIDNDGKMEIIACSYDTSDNDFIYALDDTAGLKPGWPIRASFARLSSIALADFENDGDLEIVIGGAQPSPIMEKLYAFHHDGTPVTNWPITLFHSGGAGNINSSPIIADIDGDTSRLEILLKVTDYIFSIHSDTTIMTGFPYYINDQGYTGTHAPSPAVGDIDRDGDVEYVFASCFSKIAFFNDTLPFSLNLAFWPMYKQDQFGSGTLVRLRTPVEEYPSAQLPQFNFEIIPNPVKHRICIHIPGTLNEHTNLSIFNNAGRLVRTIKISAPASNITLKGINPGVYFLKLETEITTKKLIVTK